MKPPTPLVLLTLACFASSCSKQATRPAASGPAAGVAPAANYCLPASTAWAEEEYTQWMTRAELQFFQDQTAVGQYFAHVEGRINGGLCEYRAVRKPLPAGQYVEAAVFWGLSDQDFFDKELLLLRAGFVRKSMQVFIDASGGALHQLVWLRPVGTPQAAKSAPPPTPPALNPPEPSPAAASAAADPVEPAMVTPPTADTELPPTSSADPSEEKLPTAIVVHESRSAAASDAQSPKKFTTYTVVQGDVLERIARRHHTTADAILAASELKNDSLHIGQKLKIPKK